MSTSVHPNDEILNRFVLGRLDRREMAQVEAHVRDCLRCARAGMRVPDDRLVTLLRSTSTVQATLKSPGHRSDLKPVTHSPRSNSG
jgi:anti-sigma factor RsiW